MNITNENIGIKALMLIAEKLDRVPITEEIARQKWAALNGIERMKVINTYNIFVLGE